MDKLVSVVVPIYKVEKYLDKCVESIVNQTYRNLEIILVDDGSPDNCPQMCEEWARKDERIQVIHKPNGGLSDARNFGIEKATGELISFIDSDDWIDTTFIEKMVKLQEQYNSDMVWCDYHLVFESKPINNQQYEHNVWVYEGENKFDAMFDSTVNTNSAVNKLYKREIFREIRYPVGKLMEDAFISHILLDHVDKVVVTNEKLYYYLQRDNSIMHSFDERRFHIFEVNENRLDFFNGTKYYDKVLYSCLNVCIDLYEYAKSTKVKKEFVTRILNQYNDYYKKLSKKTMKYFLFKNFRPLFEMLKKIKKQK